MIDLKKILDESKGLHKLKGVAPEGFSLVHEATLDDLKQFDVWLLWSEGKLSIEDLNRKNFEKYQ